MGIGAGWLLSTVGDLLVSAGYEGESGARSSAGWPWWA